MTLLPSSHGRHQSRARVLTFALVTMATRAMAHAQTPTSDHVLVGVSVRSAPVVDGSGSHHTNLVPVLRYYGRPWFARTTQGLLEGGVRYGLAPGLAVGAQIAYEAGRPAGDAAFLEAHHVATVSASASLGGHVEYDHQFGALPVNALGRVRQFVQTERGSQVDARVGVGVYGSKRVLAAVFAQASWADARSTRTYYGVTAEAARLTELPTFEPRSGRLFAALGASGLAMLGGSWAATWGVEMRRLAGDAGRSPLTEHSTNYYVHAGVACRLF